MLVGFIHGVMNTDNMTISGETIDYGPCAFMDAYDPATVFSSIDHGGRYAYGNQPQIAQWNLARLAETLLPLFDVETGRGDRRGHRRAAVLPRPLSTGTGADGMRAKLGLGDGQPGDGELIDDLLALLHGQQVDFTSSLPVAVVVDTRRSGACPIALRRAGRVRCVGGPLEDAAVGPDP